jgi:hypothetical protein
VEWSKIALAPSSSSICYSKKKVFVFTFPKALLRPLPLRCTIHQVVAESECWSMCAKTAKNKKHATSQKSDGAT